MKSKWVAVALALCAALGYAQERNGAKTNAAGQTRLATDATNHGPWEDFRSPTNADLPTNKAAPRVRGTASERTPRLNEDGLVIVEDNSAAASFSDLKIRAEKGDTEAQYGLGQTYQARGRPSAENLLDSTSDLQRFVIGCKTNMVEALQWYRKGA